MNTTIWVHIKIYKKKSENTNHQAYQLPFVPHQHIYTSQRQNLSILQSFQK
jgi:hypothetical protein